MLENNQTKKCKKCQCVKDLSEFNFRSDTKRIHAQCKDCLKKRRISYKLSHNEEIKESNRLYREKNRQIIRERDRLFYVSNSAEIKKYQKYFYEINKDYIKIRVKEYNKTIIGKAVGKNTRHKRRYQKINGDVTTNQILELEQSAKVCYWCNCKINKTTKIHIDHYIPLSKGGEHTISNLVVSCATCNQKKQAKDPINFANSIGRLL